MIKSIGAYKIIRQLGEGAMGSVYLGSLSGAEKPVAIKIVKSEMMVDKQVLKRFEREIVICKSFSHPYVIKLLDGGIDSETNSAFLVMEYLEGNSLQDLIIRGKIDSSLVHSVFVQQAEALSYVHHQGILHRDIKPDNIYITSEGRSVLLDFGLAVANDMTRLSKTGFTVGTLMTMSPEQLRGETLSPATDIYSLGITMYYALTGVIPYGVDKMVALAHGGLSGPDKTPVEINSKVSLVLNNVVLRCLSSDKNDRFIIDSTFLTESA